LDGRRHPAVVVLVDGVGPFLAAFDDAAGLEVADAFARIWSDGPPLGVHVAAAMDRIAALPAALAAIAVQRWTFGAPPGRFVAEPSGLTAQVCRPSGSGSDVEPTSPPRAIGSLPAEVRLSQPATVAGRPWLVPVGIGDDDLEPVALPFWPGDHALVVGPGRSGRTTTLAAVATALLAAGVEVAALTPPRSWLSEVAGVRVVGEPGDAAGVPFLLVDDADTVPDDAALVAMVAGDATHVVAAGRADGLRGLYGHWTRTLRRSRLGVLLQPDVDLDGELLGTTLPRRVPLARLPGRGHLVVDGAASVAQVGRP
jgi:S-DNA-T family DNA segregation ATPase FtsK/SpoIIIE